MHMNKQAYESSIKENLAWLEKQEKTLERDHIISIVKNSVSLTYPKGDNMKPLSDEEFEKSKKWFNEVQGNIAIVPSIYSLIIELIATVDSNIQQRR